MAGARQGIDVVSAHLDVMRGAVTSSAGAPYIGVEAGIAA